MKKIVLKSAIEDEKSKRKVLRIIAGVQGVDSVAVDMKAKMITVIGEAVDPVYLTSKVRKFGYTELVSVGPAKEEKKEAEKKPQADQKKADKNAEPPTVVYAPMYYPYEYTVVHQDYPNSCTIS